MRLVAQMVMAAVVVVAAPARAAPCEVEVVRAPEGVREVVEQSVAAEPRCATPLEVRIVETDQGLYVVAQDREGRVLDRVVPDAQSAGVLIASWASDESVPHAPAPIVTAATPLHSDELREEARSVETPAVKRSEHQWIRFARIWGLAGAMLSLGAESSARSMSNGARGSVGVWSRGPWTIDATFDFVDDMQPAVGYGDGYGFLAVREYNALASLGYVLRSGRWSATPALGLGVRRATMFYLPSTYDVDTMYPYGVERQGFLGVAQASVLGAVDFADRLQLTVQMASMLHTDPWQMHENIELIWLAGVGVVL